LSTRVRIRAALCLALALANSGPALADSKVYRWLDENGQVHMTATPPPEGALPAPPPAAAPQSFGTQVEVETETQPGAGEEPAAAPPAPAVPPAARAVDRDEDPCAGHAAEIEAWLAAERQLPRLQAVIERIEADPVHASATESCPRYSPCTYSSFTREEELRRANEELRQAEEKVADAEARAHQSGTPDRCLVDPND
jgi:hypothetical protein